MKQQSSSRQSAAMRARARRMRAMHRRRMALAIIVFFILGVVAGIFAYRWFNGRGADVVQKAPAATVAAEVTPEPEATPEAADAPEEGEAEDDLFLEVGETSEEDSRAEQEAFPEVDSKAEIEAANEVFGEAETENEAEAVVSNGAEAEKNAEPEAESEAEPEAETETEAEAEPETEAEPEVEIETEPETEPETEAEAEPEAETETEAEAEPEAEAEAEAEAETETEPETETEAQTEAEVEPEAETEPEAEAETEAQAEEEAAQPQGVVAEGQPLVLVPKTETEATAEPEAAEEPEAEAEAEAADETETAVEPEADAEPEVTAVPDLPSDQVPEYDLDGAEVPDEYKELPDENGVVQAEEGEALTNYGPQVIAIVPHGESFTYTTEINADGNARVEATDAPYETLSFTQTMKGFMRPTDFADRYSTQYKLQGDEAGAGFELVLNDYDGEATIIPQNVIDVSLRSESGNTVERGYQLMDSEIAGNYGVALNSNVPKTLYKRYQYSETGEEMAYLVVTTYKGGDTQMILFELESDEPDAEPEIVYSILQRGVEGDEVLNLQNRLVELGYLTGNVDGSFGQKTEDAIKAAQAAFGMAQTGVADNAFQQRLYEGAAIKASEATGYVTLSDGSTGDAVVRLQVRLRELGYYEGKADGGYGPMMVAAVKKAQAAFGMEQTGIADSAFQEQAFAGAETESESSDSEAEIPDDGVSLGNGSTGDAVVKLQISLREQGFYDGKADGGYGPNTVAAVKKAQEAFGMEQTGVADAAFQQRLYGEEAE